MYPETMSLICDKICSKGMYKKLLITGVILGLGILSVWSQIQIQDLKTNQTELNKIIDENTEDNSKSKKTLLDQVLENSKDRGKIVIQGQEDQYAETSGSVGHSNFNETFERKCQDEQTAYNSCLIKYNTEILEYQNCQSGSKNFGCPLSSWQPINTCGANVSSSCKKQVLGHY